MPSFFLTKKAKADLIDIALYTETTWNREQRNEYLKELDDAFHDLTKMPHKGSKCDYIREGYRKFPIGKHLIFYRQVEDNNIEIVRILHGSMDVERRLIE
ncbi:MAG: type II toxin-antitoxin system RelE/ParE family toxin [Candidatus Dadabacteria bacterium]|nr:type II toxin-antitoxin system RelE/ParE family toxin [Candidatus Dadabacteria bacterium]NIX16686.1 type II toxin-antitoxin system RelE/ParE family toxin [Candidatus Dadabacteria bacterium]